MTTEAEILFEERSGLGIITLNRAPGPEFSQHRHVCSDGSGADQMGHG